MAIVGEANSIRRVLTEIRHFLFCCHSSHFAAFPPRTKKNKFKLKEGEKEVGKTAHGNGPETKTEKRDKCDDTPEILRQHERKIHAHFVV